MKSPKLSPSWRNGLLTVHIASAAGVLGADLVLLVLGIASVQGGDPVTIYPAARLIASAAIAPLAVAALATGILVAVVGQWGLLRYWWVASKLALTAVLTAVVLFVLVPRLEATAAAVSATAPAALATDERLPLMIAPAAGSTLLLVALALAVFKPRWRLLGD